MVKSLRFADGVEMPVPGFGAMGISFAMGNSLSYDEAEPVLLKALELGCTFWDTAVRCHSQHPQIIGTSLLTVPLFSTRYRTPPA